MAKITLEKFSYLIIIFMAQSLLFNVGKGYDLFLPKEEI